VEVNSVERVAPLAAEAKNCADDRLRVQAQLGPATSSFKLETIVSHRQSAAERLLEPFPLQQRRHVSSAGRMELAFD